MCAARVDQKYANGIKKKRKSSPYRILLENQKEDWEVDLSRVST